MVSDFYKCIFIHIPKNAGTSVEIAFDQPSHDYSLKHSLPKQIVSQIGLDKFRSYLKFTVVRNPWDRAVSQYFFNKSVCLSTDDADMTKHITSIRDKANALSFKDWIRLETPNFRKQMDYLVYDGEICVDVILRFERLKAGFKNLCSRIGANLTLPHFNKSKHEYYTYYYDQENIDIISDVYRCDIETFNYRYSTLLL